jgi:hypothetical protein
MSVRPSLPIPEDDSFRFCAKRVFLTYPQSEGLTKERLLEHLVGPLRARWACVALEQHEGGGNHLHAYAEWYNQRVDTRDCRYFDLDGRHPNISAVGSKARVLAYVQKGGDYIGNIESSTSTTVRYGEIIETSSGRADFLGAVTQSYPRDACLHYAQLEYFAERTWPDEKPEYTPTHTTFVEPDGLAEWKRVNLSLPQV